MTCFKSRAKLLRNSENKIQIHSMVMLAQWNIHLCMMYVDFDDCFGSVWIFYSLIILSDNYPTIWPSAVLMKPNDPLMAASFRRQILFALFHLTLLPVSLLSMSLPTIIQSKLPILDIDNCRTLNFPIVHRILHRIGSKPALLVPLRWSSPSNVILIIFLASNWSSSPDYRKIHRFLGIFKTILILIMQTFFRLSYHK